MYFTVTFSQLIQYIKVNAAHLSSLDSMATAEKLDREKHHFNPAENHHYPFNSRTTIQRDYLAKFATPPYSPPDFSVLESGLQQCSVRHYETTLLIRVKTL